MAESLDNPRPILWQSSYSVISHDQKKDNDSEEEEKLRGIFRVAQVISLL